MLSQLFREHRLPAVALNACQSDGIDDHATGAFASVAAALVRAGVRSGVAMTYSLSTDAPEVSFGGAVWPNIARRYGFELS